MSTQHHDIFEHRKQFQVERIILFSDAVFAIAITLLIIEIRIPHFEGEVTQQMVVKGLKERIPDFIAFVVSFAVIGQFWTNHHRLFAYVKDYTPALLWLNLLMLLWIALMPFSTYLIMQYGGMDATWCWYSMNLALIAASLYLLWKYIGGRKALCNVYDDKPFLKYSYRRSMAVVLIFLAGGLLTLLPFDAAKWTARFVFLLIIPAMSILRRRYNKKYGKAKAQQG
jgi:uncharacterized membrane protein